MLPNCHLCVVIGSSPVAFYFFVCTCCGFLVLCAWCACEHRLRGSPRSERAAPRRNSSRSDVSIRLDEIRRAKIVSRSLATAKVTTAAIHPSRTPLGDRRVLPRPPTASSGRNLRRRIIRPTARSQSRVLYWIRLDGKWMRARSALNHTKKTTSSRTQRNRGASIIFIRSA